MRKHTHVVYTVDTMQVAMDKRRRRRRRACAKDTDRPVKVG